MKKYLFLIVLPLLFLPVSSEAAKEYRVMIENDGVYHIFIDILADLNITSAIEKEDIFRRISTEVCGTSNCTTRFWLRDDYGSKSTVLDKKARATMVAEYRQEAGQLFTVYHNAIEKRKAEFAQAECVKEVFNKYCLGGSTSQLPPGASLTKSGITSVWVYGDNTGVLTVNGKVAEVVRLYPNMSWLKFGSTESKLAELYGVGRDYSFFPSYAKRDTERATAIRIGRAQVVKSWQQDGWTIRWSWINDSGRLSYTHMALKESYDAEAPGEGL